MGKGKDITGQKFGMLTTIEPTTKRSGSSIVWKCKCDCGKIAEVSRSNLVGRHTKSCGCLSIENQKNMAEENIVNMKNKRFGRLIVLERTSERCGSSVVWKCECDCGNIAYISQASLNSGHTESCGCKNKEWASKLGKSWLKDLTGKKFGRLTVIYRVDDTISKRVSWHCKCDCGNELDIRADCLIDGTTKSCGCLSLEINIQKAKDWFDHNTNITYVLKNNKSARSDSGTGVRGVSKIKGGKYMAQIKFQKKQYYLGVFSDIDDAGRAYEKARENLYGDFLSWYNEQKSNNLKEKQA